MAKKKKDDETKLDEPKEERGVLSKVASALMGDGKESLPPEPLPALPKRRVVKDWKGSFRGQVSSLAEGKVIDPRYYGGAAGIAHLQDAGCQLEVIQDDPPQEGPSGDV